MCIRDRLYIVPGIAGAVFAQSLYRGDVQKLWNFTDEEATGGDAKTEGGDGTAEGDTPSIEPKKDQ